MENQTGVTINENGEDLNFRVESVDNDHMLFVDGGNSRVNVNGDGPGLSSLNVRDSFAVTNTAGSQRILMGNQDSAGVDNPSIISAANGRISLGNGDTWNSSSGGNFTDRFSVQASEVVVNESGLDTDFRVETSGSSSAFFVDGSTNNIGVSSGTEWAIVGGGSGTSSSVVSIDMSYDATIYAGSAYWAGGLNIGTNFWRDASGYHYKRTSRQATAYQQSSQGGSHAFFSQTSGDAGAAISWNNLLYMDRTQTIFNDDGTDTDFRVESVSNTHMLYVDASEDEVVVGEGGVNQANATLALNTGSNKHGKSIHSNNTITGSSEASVMAEGTFAVDTTSLGTKLTIPIFSQGSSWKKYIIEFMFSSAEYNLSGNANAGTCTLAFTSLSVADNMVLLSSTGNVTSANVSGSNIEINFTNGFVAGTNNYEGVLVYYKILSSVPSYVQTWNATLN